MIEALQIIKSRLELIPDVTTCQIGLEDDISPNDYPIVRIIAGRSSDAGYLKKKHQIKIYFGFNLSDFDGLELIYNKLYTLETAIYDALVPDLDPYLCRWIDTISDEDRIKEYKILCAVFEVER